MRDWMIALALLTVASATAAPMNVDIDSLLKNSPFAPGANAPVARTTGPTKVEFRGYVRENGEYRFSLFDVAGSKGAWVGLNQQVDDFAVKSFDEQSETVTVEFQGQVLSLGLKESKTQDAPMQMVEAPPPMPGPNPAAASGSSADDARRLEQVAAEVRRRRALRQAAAGSN